MQTIVNLVVSIFLGSLAFVCFLAIALCLFADFADVQDDAKMFGIGGAAGIIGASSTIIIYLMKTKGLI